MKKERADWLLLKPSQFQDKDVKEFFCAWREVEFEDWSGISLEEASTNLVELSEDCSLKIRWDRGETRLLS